RRLPYTHGVAEPPVCGDKAFRNGEPEEPGTPPYIGKPGFHVRRALPGQLDRQEGDRSSQRHGEGEESRTGSGYRQGKQTGHQVRHGRSSSEAREVRLRQFQGGNGESWISYP